MARIERLAFDAKLVSLRHVGELVQVQVEQALADAESVTQMIDRYIAKSKAAQQVVDHAREHHGKTVVSDGSLDSDDETSPWDSAIEASSIGDAPTSDMLSEL